ncbi:hypothetical protein HDU78_009940 [Chytriomyces hyalinus]|nr:hypothetical protein HDU78_009940 [Chytriomyces hyalinus]
MRQVPTPRPYQLELFQRAQEHNTIAFLDTGTGKTLVSILLMEKMAVPLVALSLDADALQHTIDSELKRQPKKIAFVAPTVALVRQQSEKMRRTSDLIVCEFTRESQSGSLLALSFHQFRKQVADSHVLVFTPQTLLNTLRHGYLKMGADLSLIVFDECHHAVGSHPYLLIMNEFYTPLPNPDRPKILGMTASPIFQKSRTLEDSQARLVELQASLDCRIVTVSDRNSLDGFVSQAKEYLMEFNPQSYTLFDSIADGNPLEPGSTKAAAFFHFYVTALKRIEALEEVSVADSVKKCLNLVKDLEIDLGVWCAGRLASYLYSSVSEARHLRRGDSNEEAKEIVSVVTGELPSIPNLSEVQDSDIGPKVWSLINLIEQRFKDGNSNPKAFRAMVFVEKRTTASTLCDLLTQLAPRHFPGIACGFVTGQGSNSSTHARMNSNIQNQALEQFRSGEVNLLVVTRVAEEGIDIPACKLIIIFDLFRSNTGYVQSRGRARDVRGSEYIILVRRNDTHAVETISHAKAAEMMTRALVSRMPATEDASNAASVSRGEEDNGLISEFVGSGDVYSIARKSGAPGVSVATLSGVNGVLTRAFRGKPEYRLLLEGNSDTNIDGWDEYVRRKEKQRLLWKSAGLDEESIALPRQTSVSGFVFTVLLQSPSDAEEKDKETVEIVGSMRFTRKAAMQSAGIEAIRYLHGCGLLNDHLLPAYKKNRKNNHNRTFSFARELLELTRGEKKEKSNGAQQLFVYDPASGEGKEDALFAHRRKIPKCLSKSVLWKDLVDEFVPESSQSDKPLQLSEDKVSVFVTVFVLGPEAEIYTRNRNPPVCAFQGLCSNASNQGQENHFYRALQSYPPSNEPRRTFAIVTAQPIPTDKIPSFPIFFQSTASKVDIFPFTSNYARISEEDNSVQMLKSEWDSLKQFQSEFWNLVLHRHKTNGATASSSESTEPIESAYLIAPMIGSPHVDPRRRFARLAEQETAKRGLNYNSGPWNTDTLLSASDHKWRIDWDTIQRVNNPASERVTLYDWVLLLQERLSAQLRHRLSTKKRKFSTGSGQNRHEGTLKLPFTNTLGETNYLSDDDSSVESSDESDSDKGVESSFSDIVQSLGLGSKKRAYKRSEVESNSSGKRKREEETSTEDTTSNELHLLWNSIESSGQMPSFEKVYSLASRAGSKMSGLSPDTVWNNIRSTPGLLDAVNQVLQQTLVQTPHNKIVYVPAELSSHLNASSHFETVKFTGVSCFGEYFEKLGYSLSHPEAPLVQVHSIPARQNFTRPSRPAENDSESPETNSLVRFLSMDVCTVVPVPAELARLAQIIPSVLWRIESYCQMDQLRKDLDIPELSMKTLQHAFTASSALEPFSYERLETLGDAFLKLTCTSDLIHRYQTANEGDLSSIRSAVVCNKNLARIAQSFDLGGLMIVSPFKARLWHPPRPFWKHDVSAGSLNGVELHFSEKRLADFVEALIGAAVIDGGVECGLKFLIKLGLVSGNAIQNLADLDNLDFQTSDSTDSTRFLETKRITPKTLNSGFSQRKLEKRMGYQFQNPQLGLQAMTHASHISGGASYERLEFLGDAVLDWLVMQHFFRAYPDLQPDKLSDLRQAAVNNESFCRLSAVYGLHQFVQMSSAPLKAELESYLTHLAVPGVLAKDPLDVAIEGPKVLGDLFEAIVGAIFLDSGNNLNVVFQVLKPMLAGFLQTCVNPSIVQKSPIRKLHEHLQSLGFRPAEIWYTFQELTENHVTRFSCNFHILNVNIAEENGSSQQLAKRRTSVSALKWIMENQKEIDALVSRRNQNPGKSWRNPTNAAKVNTQLTGETKEKSGERSKNGDVALTVSQDAVAEERNVQYTMDQPEFFKDMDPFEACLLALELKKMSKADEDAREQAQQSSAPSAPRAISSTGDYFLTQLLAAQEQERMQLQQRQSEQLFKLFGSNQE